MKHIDTTAKKGLFKQLMQSSSVQAAMMTLGPGQSSSEETTNEHPGAEQWLFVVRGLGTARVGGRSVRIKAGSLLLIEKSEPHRITNTGKKAMATINFYAPPAYGNNDEVKPSVGSTKS